MPHFARLAASILLLALASPVPAISARPARIALVADGPGFFREYAPLLRGEIEALLAGEFDVAFTAGGLVEADWTLGGIRREIEAVLSDAEIDVVIVLGVIGAQAALDLRPSKPLFVPFLIDPELQRFPVRDDGTSGVRNLNYLGSRGLLRNALDEFSLNAPVTNIGLLTAAPLVDDLPWLAPAAKERARSLGLELTTIPVGLDDPVASLEALPPEVDGVVISPMVHLTRQEEQRLIDGLIERKLPSFAFGSREEVEAGILLGIAPANRPQRFARRVALNVQRALLGEDPGTFPVEFPRGERLTLNARTARAIGFSPRWDTLTEAEVLYEDDPVEATLSLEESMREAVARNLDLAARHEEVRAGLQRVREARSALLPELEVRAEAVQIDADRALASGGTASERSATGSLVLRQLLYDDDAWAGFDVEKERQVARRAARRELELNITRDGAVGFLDVLRARALERIQRENVRLTRQNLELARVRGRIGTAAASEIYRWESQIATDRQAVIDAVVATAQAKIALNRLLRRELEQDYEASDVDVDALGLVFTDPVLSTTIDNPEKYRVFRDFLARLSLRQSPELAQLDAGVSAQERVVKNRRRDFLLPSVGLQASVADELGRGGARGDLPEPIASLTPDSNDSDWSIALTASYPLFAGGRRFAELRRSDLELRQLKTQRAATRDRIEQRTRSALLATGGAFAQIALARDAAEAAQANFDLVGDAYARGAAEILDLLDAQNAALVANQVAANAEYDFLIELMQAQRAIGRFDLFMTDEERSELLREYQDYFRSRGIHP